MGIRAALHTRPSGVLTALRDENEDLRGFCKVARDLTETKRSKKERE